MLSLLEMKQEEIARRCGRRRGTVSTWMTGRFRPDADMRLVLRALYGIPIEAWSEPASAVTPQQRVER